MAPRRAKLPPTTLRSGPGGRAIIRRCMLETATFGFDLERLVTDCRAALAEDMPERAMREVVAKAVAEPAALLNALGEPKRAEIQKLHHAADLTILNVIWAPRMTLMPHDHRMWAVIGMYAGREDNIFWRRLGD